MSDETAGTIERRFLGIAEVDSGTLLIGDPAYVLPRAADGKPGVDYQEVLDAIGPAHGQQFGGMPVVLLQDFSGDGAFPVFGEFVHVSPARSTSMTTPTRCRSARMRTRCNGL